MKSKYYNRMLRTPLLALAMTTGVASAGTTEMAPAPAPAPAEDVVSGVLNLDFNSHFISYGNDVWQDGTSMSDWNFNPLLELSFALPSDFTLTLGTWWDVNSKGDSPIGGKLQEVDVWSGLSYTYDKFTIGATYQAWMYAGATEQIVDVKLAYDCFLSPSITLHNRVAAGAAGSFLDTGFSPGDTGSVLVLGLSHGIEAGPVSLTFPLNVGFFLTDDFYAVGSDSGFGYVSFGANASLPLTPYIGTAFGEWSLNGALTYYYTEDDVIPGNPDDSFVTAMVGLGLSF